MNVPLVTNYGTDRTIIFLSPTFLFKYLICHIEENVLLPPTYWSMPCFQQSMQDQNMMTTTTAATIVLRDNDQPVVLDAKEEKENAKREETKRVSSYRTPAKSKIQRLNSQYIKWNQISTQWFSTELVESRWIKMKNFASRPESQAVLVHV